MSEPAEIKAKLVMDDAASRSVDMVRSGFDKLGHTVGFAQGQVLGFVKSAASMALGFQFDHGIESIKEWGKEAMAAAKAEAEQVKEIAGLLAAQDKLDRSMDDLKKDASEYKEKLEEMGIQAGVSTDAIVESFTEIASRSSKAPDDVLKMTEQMMYASKIVPGGLAGITEGYRGMEMGMIRAKNPLVQLIAQSHLMTGNAKEIAKQLQKMAPEEAMKVADMAIGKMAEKGKALPLKGGALVQSIKDMAENAMEDAGGAILKGLAKPYGLVRNILMENREELANFYGMIGDGLGEAMTIATEKAKQGIDYVKKHGDEIKHDIMEAWEYAKKVVDFIVAHKTEITLGLGALTASKVAAPVAGAAVSVAGGAATMATGAWSFLKMLGSSDVPKMTGGLSNLSQKSKVYGEVINNLLIPSTIGMSKEAATLHQSITNAAKGFGALALAVGATYLAVDQITKLNRELNAEYQGEKDHINEMLKLAKRGHSDQLAAAMEYEKKKRPELASAMEATAKLGDLQMAQVKHTAGIYEGLFKSGIIDPKYLVNAFQQASDMGNEAAQEYAANLLVNSGFTLQELHQQGYKLGTTLKDFGDLFSGASEATMLKLKVFLGNFDPKNMKAAAPQINFNNNKFEIHQDFRNEDPDRIALVFRRDILKAAEHRRQARMGTAFGP